MHSDALLRLAEYFAEFPGIGERQSKRFVYFLLSKHPEYLRDLAHSIMDIQKNISRCELCYHFFSGRGEKLCETCTNPATDTTLLMVVEKDADYEAMKKSGMYLGRYFVLGGLVPITSKEAHSRVRIDELVRALKQQAGLKEIILALSLNPHGEHTDTYLREVLSSTTRELGITITSLGRGLSTGTELEYSDTSTLKNAFKNRQ
ncbi:MAG: toprim domain-containing protein [Candidatus Pacebacteria bacterium]|jgi:recombination protein RecR|nr:toprim domain-containing protein [Candidatus Paceibacterota bacterium]